MTKYQINEARALRASGKTLASIGQHFGVTREAIRQALKKIESPYSDFYNHFLKLCKKLKKKGLATEHTLLADEVACCFTIPATNIPFAWTLRRLLSENKLSVALNHNRCDVRFLK